MAKGLPPSFKTLLVSANPCFTTLKNRTSQHLFSADALRALRRRGAVRKTLLPRRIVQDLASSGASRLSAGLAPDPVPGCDTPARKGLLLRTHWTGFHLGEESHFKRVLMWRCADRIQCGRGLVDWLGLTMLEVTGGWLHRCASLRGSVQKTLRVALCDANFPWVEDRGV